MTRIQAARSTLVVGLGLVTLACGSASPTAATAPPQAAVSADSSAAAQGLLPDWTTEIKGIVGKKQGTNRFWFEDGSRFISNDETTVLRNGQPAKAAEVVSGDYVRVRGFWSRLGVVATSIEATGKS